MSNTFGFLSDDTFAAKLDELNGHLSDIAAAQIKGTKVTSWKTVQRLVRAGVADKAFAIGDQLTCSKGDDVLTWDIIGIDVDTPADSQYTHSMTLQLHDCLPNSMQFDAPEAMYYAAEELAAGTYHVTPTGGFNTTGMGNGKTYQFPLTKAVPKGGQIYWYGSWNKDPLNYDIYTYASATSTTEIETVAPSEGSGGTELTPLNTVQRMLYGSNNYSESAIRQFLNSDKGAGAFWTPKTDFDSSPSWYNSTAGFMNGLDDDFLAVIGEVTKNTALNTVTDTGGASSTQDKFFLLSRQEVNMGMETGTVIEGEAYPYYSQFSDNSTAGTNADGNRIKYRGGNVQWWWLRSPGIQTAYGVYAVDGDGSRVGGCADESAGASPACCVV